MLSDHLVFVLESPDSSTWISSAGADNQPDIAKVTGLVVEADRRHLRCFIPVRFSRTLLMNVGLNPNLSFMAARLPTYESYQVKGHYLGHYPMTPTERVVRDEYLLGFSDAAELVGLSGEKSTAAYTGQPCLVLRMTVSEVFEQTPKAGTGEKVPLD